MKDCSKLSRLLLLDDIRYEGSLIGNTWHVGETLGYHLEHIFVTTDLQVGLSHLVSYICHY